MEENLFVRYIICTCWLMNVCERESGCTHFRYSLDPIHAYKVPHCTY